MRPPDADRAAADSAVKDAAERMRRLDPGPLAELRRMEVANPAPAFWRIAVNHRIMQRDQPRHCDWIRILRILALLMPKGEVPPVISDPGSRLRRRLHNYRRPLGEVLCDGGDGARNWRPEGDPPDGVVSERRLVALLAKRGPARIDAVERAVRMVARQLGAGLAQPPHETFQPGVDVTQIAAAILWPADTAPIAEAYFRRLDQVARAQSEESQT